MATSAKPERMTSTIGSRTVMSVARSTSVYATTSASEACHTWDSARPRPFRLRRTYSTVEWAAANAAPITGVEAVLALSAMMIVSSVARPVSAASSASMEAARPDSSLYTGTTRSTVVGVMVGVGSGCASGWCRAMLSCLMASRLPGAFGPSIGRSCGPAVDAAS